MESLQKWVVDLNGAVWGSSIPVLTPGTGLYLTLGLKFTPLVRLGVGFRLPWQGRGKDGESSGKISPFQVLVTCLTATVGTGNVAGVATAIFLGDPGALLWTWCTVLMGMATKFPEVVPTVYYRERDERNEHAGGPMYTTKNGLGKRRVQLGATFALFGGLAGLGIGNMVRVNSMADVLEVSLGASDWVTGVATMLATGLVTLSGTRRIGKAAEALVPFTCIGHIVASVIVLVVHAEAIPGAFRLISTHAFTLIAVTGGFTGATVMAIIRFGIAREVFSNEAGLGTAGIAQAAGTTHSAVCPGLIGMLGTLTDTLIICSLTSLAITTSGVWISGASGAALSSAAFEATMPGISHYVLPLALVAFAYTTILGWSYYGERRWEYLVGTRTILLSRTVWALAILFGTMTQLDPVWLVADTLNALMATPNLIALLLLSPMVLHLTREYLAKARS